MRSALIIAMLACAGCSESPQRPVAPPKQTAQTQVPIPAPAQAQVQTPAVDHSPFLRSMLADLDGFKGSESFVAYGFGRGGPHFAWQERLIEESSRAGRGVATIGFGLLQALASEYLQSRGQETKATQHFRKEFLDTIEGR